MRRRLFSGSSGRRTSISKSSSTPPSTADDDLRSLSSLSIDGVESISKDIGMRSKPVMLSFSNMGNQLSLVTENACVSPAWEEMSSTPANSKRVSHGEHIVQQHIMSPAEMLKLEQQFNNGEWEQDDREDTQSELTSERGGEGRTPKLDIEPGDFGMAFIGGGRAKSMRSRTDSLLSNMSAFGPEERTGNGSSGADDLGLRGLVGVAQTFGTPTKRPATAEATRNAGWGMSPGRSTTYSPPSTRPSTAQPSFASPPVSPVTATSVSEMTSGGLPPPPRPRLQRERQADATANRTSAIPYQALSPPPRRRPTLQSIASRDGDGAGSSSIRSSRPPSAFGQKAFNRRSLAKKPSFLEIEDEWDVANDAVSLAEMSVNSYATSAYHTAIDHEQESSFLDLDRGTSFDTIRSFDEDGRGF
ncbi:hypothetical protein BC629DRAFT_1555982 [Irpex lacteus]|nr:hypothetical protein BC629DRAFT_1555982 [Irpex lacteus]